MHSRNLLFDQECRARDAIVTTVWTIADWCIVDKFADGLFSSSHLMRCSTTVCRRHLHRQRLSHCRHYIANAGGLEMQCEQRCSAFIWVRFGFASTSSHIRLIHLSSAQRATWHADMTHVANIMPTNNTYDSSAPSYLVRIYSGSRSRFCADSTTHLWAIQFTPRSSTLSLSDRRYAIRCVYVPA